MACPLCNLDLSKDDKIIILDTKNKKGHKGRIMVVWREHKKDIEKEDNEYAITKLKEVAKNVFKYTHYYEIYQDKYSSIMEHWHRIAADIDPNADDFEQVLDTPREIYRLDGTLIKIINV